MQGIISLDRILQEVDFQINQLDLCVQRSVARMLKGDFEAFSRFICNAQDANRKSCILAELKLLVLEELNEKGGNTCVPQSVLDLVQMGRDSCRYHLQEAFGDSVRTPDGIYSSMQKN
eukprot:g7902.t1